ncbi:MAG: CAP family protein [Crocinitomicaceae bacterium]
MVAVKHLIFIVGGWFFLSSFVFSVRIPPKLGNAIDFDKEALLERHNYYRKKVGVPPLEWSDSLSVYAQNWADQLAKKCMLKHRPQDDYGENVYGSSGETTAIRVVDYWASEEEFFNHRRPVYKSGKGYGHYTQIIWRDTKLLGAGVAQCKGGGQIWVCNYDPAGNWTGENVY